MKYDIALLPFVLFPGNARRISKEEESFVVMRRCVGSLSFWRRGKGTENDQDTVQTSGSGQQVEDASEMESQGDRGSQEKQENDYGLEEQEVFE